MTKSRKRGMNTVRRTRGIMKFIRKAVFRHPVQKYVTSGDRACGSMMHGVRRTRRNSDPSDSAILACALFDLLSEIAAGFWDYQMA